MAGSSAALRVVIADDHAMVRSGLALLMEAEQDIEVVGEAADGAAALRLIQRRAPDVALVDLFMPGLGGVEVCEAVREAGLGTAIVLVTGHEDPEMATRALEAGAGGFVLKSSGMPELVRAVRMAGTGRVYLDGALAAGVLAHSRRDSANVLTRREQEVLQLLSEGKTTEHVAAELFLAPTTVRSYADSAMQKLDSRNRTQAVAKALRLALIR